MLFGGSPNITSARLGRNAIRGRDTPRCCFPAEKPGETKSEAPIAEIKEG
jgi:hypothetical protein